MNSIHHLSSSQIPQCAARTPEEEDLHTTEIANQYIAATEIAIKTLDETTEQSLKDRDEGLAKLDSLKKRIDGIAKESSVNVSLIVGISIIAGLVQILLFRQ